MVKTQKPPNAVAITHEEAARRIGVSSKTIRNWIKRGELPSIEIGGIRRVRGDLLEAWLDERTDPGKAPGEG